VAVPQVDIQWQQVQVVAVLEVMAVLVRTTQELLQLPVRQIEVAVAVDLLTYIKVAAQVVLVLLLFDT
jgi:hypothetical protein